MSSLDYLDLCRLCLVKDRASVPIFEGEGDVRQIFLKIAACLPVKVVRGDKLPKKICDDCVYKVEQFYQFWNTTANVEKQLLQWLGDVGMEDKQAYVSGVLNPDQSVEGRLNANVIQQTDEHQNNMGMNMMDTMNLDMPMMMQTEQSQMTTMNSNDTNVQTIQAVPGTSVRPPQQERRKDDEDESSEDEDNSDDECDADEGLSVKEETEETANRTIEPTFVNVSLPCDEAGPSGLQQQKINEMSDMVMAQSTDGDPKSGFIKRTEVGADNFRGLFIFDRESVIMKKWQVLEFDGKPYYAFVPVNEEPINPDDIPIIDEDENSNESKITTKDIDKEEATKIGNIYDESMDNDESFYEYDYIENDSEKEEQNEKQEIKPILINGIDDENKDPAHGDLYQVKIEGSLITLEKLAENVDGSKVEDEESILPEITNENEKIFLEKVQDSSFDVEQLQQSSGEEEEEEQIQEVPQYEEREIENTETGIMDYISVEEEGGGEEEEEEEEREEDVDDVKAIVSTAPKPSHGKIRSRTRYRPILPNPTTALKCKACSETFGSAIAFRKHVAWTHKKKVCIQENGAYICAVCDYRTLKKSLFASHLERKHETWPQKCLNLVFPCSACGFVCRSKHSLQSHFIRKHTDKFEHQCKFCPKKFKVKGDLTNHVRFHHREKPINCDVCGKLCQNTGSLYVHQKWAHYKPKFECSVCKRRMVTQENLDQHMITQHEKRENIICQECGKSFTKKDSFKRHMAVHTGSKPHHCPICNKPFARQSQLRQHVLIHTGKRPFICDICGKAFTQKPGLICHRKTHPGSHPPLPVMPIADFVKEFTAGYLLQGPGAIVEEDVEGVSE